MSTYKGKSATINRPAEELYGRFENLSYFEERLKQLPEDQLAKIGDVQFTPDSIAINTPQVGQLKFSVIERIAPTRVVFGTEASPIPLTMAVNFNPIDADNTEVTTQIDVELPAMLRTFVGPKLQEAADKFGEMMANLSR